MTPDEKREKRRQIYSSLAAKTASREWITRATVTAVDGPNDYQVTVAGRPPLLHVRSIANADHSVGEQVFLCFFNRNKQMPFILDISGSSGSSAAIVIGKLDWPAAGGDSTRRVAALASGPDTTKPLTLDPNWVPVHGSDSLLIADAGVIFCSDYDGTTHSLIAVDTATAAGALKWRTNGYQILNGIVAGSVVVGYDALAAKVVAFDKVAGSVMWSFDCTNSTNYPQPYTKRCSTVNGSTTVTVLDPISHTVGGVVIYDINGGDAVAGTGIAGGTTVTAPPRGTATTLTLSAAATATGSVTLTFTPLQTYVSDYTAVPWVSFAADSTSLYLYGVGAATPRVICLRLADGAVQWYRHDFPTDRVAIGANNTLILYVDANVATNSRLLLRMKRAYSVGRTHRYLTLPSSALSYVINTETLSQQFDSAYLTALKLADGTTAYDVAVTWGPLADWDVNEKPVYQATGVRLLYKDDAVTVHNYGAPAGCSDPEGMYAGFDWGNGGGGVNQNWMLVGGMIIATMVRNVSAYVLNDTTLSAGYYSNSGGGGTASSSSARRVWIDPTSGVIIQNIQQYLNAAVSGPGGYTASNTVVPADNRDTLLAGAGDGSWFMTYWAISIPGDSSHVNARFTAYNTASSALLFTFTRVVSAYSGLENGTAYGFGNSTFYIAISNNDTAHPSADFIAFSSAGILKSVNLPRTVTDTVAVPPVLIGGTDGALYYTSHTHADGTAVSSGGFEIVKVI